MGVLLKREKTSSGLIIPDAVQEPQAFCRVISVGQDVTYVKEGQIIVCHMRGGMDTIIDKQVLKVLKEEEIYGELTDEATIESLTEFELKASTPKQPSRIVKPGPSAMNL